MSEARTASHSPETTPDPCVPVGVPWQESSARPCSASPPSYQFCEFSTTFPGKPTVPLKCMRESIAYSNITKKNKVQALIVTRVWCRFPIQLLAPLTQLSRFPGRCLWHASTSIKGQPSLVPEGRGLGNLPLNYRYTISKSLLITAKIEMMSIWCCACAFINEATQHPSVHHFVF